MAAPEPQQVGFIGLGAMGLGMARQLLAAGFAVRGFDLDRNACAAFASSGGTVCRSVAEAAAGCTLLFVVVFTAAQAREVLFGDDGAAAALAPGATVSNHATTSPAQAQELEAECGERRLLFLDSPVTGGKAGADAGSLTIISSGSAAARNAAAKAYEAMSPRGKVVHCGDKAGAASTVKMANQMLVGVHAVAAAEALTLARAGGAVRFAPASSDAGTLPLIALALELLHRTRKSCTMSSHQGQATAAFSSSGCHTCCRATSRAWERRG